MMTLEVVPIAFNCGSEKGTSEHRIGGSVSLVSPCCVSSEYRRQTHPVIRHRIGQMTQHRCHKNSGNPCKSQHPDLLRSEKVRRSREQKSRGGPKRAECSKSQECHDANWNQSKQQL